MHPDNTWYEGPLYLYGLNKTYLPWGGGGGGGGGGGAGGWMDGGINP